MILTSVKKEYDPSGKISRTAYIIQAALEYFVTLATTNAFLTNLLTYLGFSTAQQGIISSFQSLIFVMALVSVLFIRKRTRVKSMVIIMNLLTQTFFALLYFTPIFKISANAKSVLFVIMLIIAYTFWYMSSPFRNAWMMSNVGSGIRGVFTAKKEIVSLLGGTVFSFVMGRIIDVYEAKGDIEGSFLVCGITALGLAVMNTVCLIITKEKIPEHEEKLPGFLKNLKRSWTVTMTNRSFRRVLLINSLYHVTLSVNFFNGTFQRNILGFSMTFISLLTLIYSVARALVSIPLGKIADKYGWNKMLIPCFAVSSVAYLINVFSVPAWGAVTYTIYYCLYAMAMGGMNSGMFNMPFACMEKENHSDATAWNSAIGGIVGFLASLPMSALVNYIEANGNKFLGLSVYPQQVLYAISSILFLILMVIMIRASRKQGN